MPQHPLSPAGGPTPPDADPPIPGPAPDPAKDQAQAAGAQELPGRTRRRLGLTWVLVALLAVLFPQVDAIFDALGSKDAAPDPILHPDLTIELTAKVLVGAKSVMEGLSASESDRAQVDTQFRKEFEKLAKPLDEIDSIEDPEARAAERAARFRTIMLSADFVGAEEALAELDHLLDNPDASETLLADGALVRRILTDGADSISEQDREQLIEHHGWVGRLITTFDLPGTNARRAGVLGGARTAFFALIAIGALAAVGLLAGLLVFVIAIVLIGTGRLRPRYEPDRRSSPVINAAYLQVMALFLGAFIVLSTAGRLVEELSLGAGLEAAIGVVMHVAQWALLLVALWPLARGETFANLRRGLGWHTGRGLFRELGCGVLGYVAGLPLVAIGFMLTIGLIVLFGFQPSHPIQEQARSAGPWGVVLLFTFAVVWAPLVEETMFRGAMYHSMRRWTGPIVSGLVVAFLFAAIHPQGVSTIPVLMSLAVVFALIREWRGSLIGSMTAHALHNGVLVALNVVLLS